MLLAELHVGNSDFRLALSILADFHPASAWLMPVVRPEAVTRRGVYTA